MIANKREVCLVILQYQQGSTKIISLLSLIHSHVLKDRKSAYLQEILKLKNFRHFQSWDPIFNLLNYLSPRMKTVIKWQPKVRGTSFYSLWIFFCHKDSEVSEIFINSLHLKTAENRDVLNSSLGPDQILIPKHQRVRNHNM